MEQTLITLSLLSAVMSAGLGLAFWMTLRRLGRLSAAVGCDQDHPLISVIVPARNEAHDLERAVRSILAQRSVRVQVIIVNDHSSDRTGEIADALAAENGQVIVLHDPPLADGWLGKTNAMQQGLGAATAATIVFTDADVIHAPGCFSAAIGEMRNRDIHLLSLCPRFRFESFWENVLLPHAMIAGTVQFLMQRVNDADSDSAAAAGAFILTSAEVLDRIGGLACIRAEMLDDVALAIAVKRQGFATKIYLAPELLSVRLFKGNWHAFWGLTKNILGAVKQLWMAVPAMFLPIFVYWVPIVTWLVGLDRSKPGMIVAGIIPYVVQAALLPLVLPLARIRWAKAMFFPLAALPVICCLSRALYHRCVSGGVAWRGRVIPLKKTR